ncbi:DUF4189 domain-containing protein [Nocardioides alcanivorans]|uniref:DUF4189 domain-containing protein n=1 Tax=Nocardioides alcanivorans TaxID=2897352 RepID=UPI001F3F1C36|nr:DUF4189 domain-containing protein [Nocardioides alcanivorans]
MTRIGTGRLRKLGLLLTALLLTVGVLGALSPANATGTAGESASETSNSAARTSARRVNYGAIALNTSNGWSGWSYDKASKKKAKKAAKKHCKKRAKASGASGSGCKPVVWVRNGCAAVAVKVKNGRIAKVGWGVAFKKGKAKKLAKKKAGKKAKVHTWMCTTRYR